MKEVEVKAKVFNLSDIKLKLASLGCEFSEPVAQDDTVYLHKPLTLKDVARGIVSVRIRTQNNKNILTLKKQLENGLDKLEREIVFDNPEQAADMLEILDLHAVSHLNKIRQKCRYNDLEICLDRIAGLGNFIEAEKIVDEAADSAAVQNELFAFLKTLGVAEEDRVLKGYDILLYELSNN